jgi:hypothetical protein
VYAYLYILHRIFYFSLKTFSTIYTSVVDCLSRAAYMGCNTPDILFSDSESVDARMELSLCLCMYIKLLSDTYEAFPLLGISAIAYITRKIPCVVSSSCSCPQLTFHTQTMQETISLCHCQAYHDAYINDCIWRVRDKYSPSIYAEEWGKIWG